MDHCFAWFGSCREDEAWMDRMSSEKQPDDIARLYGALRNSYRRKIVEILRDNGRAGFKELHATLRISVGALYHHLDMLEGIVTQGSDKKYELTNLGRSA